LPLTPRYKGSVKDLLLSPGKAAFDISVSYGFSCCCVFRLC